MKNQLKNILADKVKNEIAELKKEIPLWEYLLWWIMRIWLLIATILDYKEHLTDGHYNLQMTANFILMFILPTLHLLPRRKTFFARLPFRTQTIACAMIFITCVLGLHYGCYGKIYWFDTAVHFVGGFVVVPVGVYIVKALSSEKMSPLMASVSGFGLSCFAALFWEFYEFTFDNITGHNTQAWTDGPSDFFRKILPDMDPQRFPLLDTMTDLSFGLAGAVLGGIVLRLVYEHRAKKGQALSRSPVRAAPK